ncbi:hypothetical protein SAMN04489841_4237 [Natrinema salaciae]|uniref:Uncharacterized protein n=1 Tax=Natrinema salaciae TaxID=1186196 RepID=A0A1H9R2K6_9EURY|nr:hypothetical protein SAMN04489841_4237 [Natrinema salaciae]
MYVVHFAYVLTASTVSAKPVLEDYNKKYIGLSENCMRVGQRS